MEWSCSFILGWGQSFITDQSCPLLMERSRSLLMECSCSFTLDWGRCLLMDWGRPLLMERSCSCILGIVMNTVQHTFTVIRCCSILQISVLVGLSLMSGTCPMLTDCGRCLGLRYRQVFCIGKVPILNEFDD